MKYIINVIFSSIVSLLLFLLGDIGVTFYCLLVLMCVDYLLGIISGVKGKSKKSESGKLSSKQGFIGLLKKACILLCVILGNMLDMLLGFNYVRNLVILSFSLNEIISVVENLNNIGIKVPNVIIKCIEILNEKGEKNDKI